MSHDHNSAGASHGNTKQYTIGFILSVILTIIPFGMVMAGGFGRGILITVISITAVAQILIQLIYFLLVDLLWRLFQYILFLFLWIMVRGIHYLNRPLKIGKSLLGCFLKILISLHHLFYYMF